MTLSVSLQDKVVLIVGGAGSIGAAAAMEFARGGAKLIITYRGPELEAAAQAVLQALPGKDHSAFDADVADTKTLTVLRDEIMNRYGRLDILINAAGFTKPVPHADLDALDDDLIDRMFEVNWRGQFATIRTFAPLLKSSGNGLIRVAFLDCWNERDRIVDRLLRSQSWHRCHDQVIGACARPPGSRARRGPRCCPIRALFPNRGSDFNQKAASTTPMKRIGTVDDIAAAILSCATLLTFSTGTTIVVDGGRAL